MKHAVINWLYLHIWSNTLGEKYIFIYFIFIDYLYTTIWGTENSVQSCKLKQLCKQWWLAEIVNFIFCLLFLCINWFDPPFPEFLFLFLCLSQQSVGSGVKGADPHTWILKPLTLYSTVLPRPAPSKLGADVAFHAFIAF